VVRVRVHVRGEIVVVVLESVLDVLFERVDPDPEARIGAVFADVAVVDPDHEVRGDDLARGEPRPPLGHVGPVPARLAQRLEHRRAVGQDRRPALLGLGGCRDRQRREKREAGRKALYPTTQAGPHPVPFHQ
jgi:hypothetical protein